MGITSEDLRIKEQTTFCIWECVTEFRKLRWNRDGTKDIFSPCLTEISKCSSFHELIHLCSAHDPTVLKSVLQSGLGECAKAEEQLNEEKAKKREAETQLVPEHHKQLKVQRLDQAKTVISNQRRSVESTEDWTGIEYGLESEEEMEYESDIHQEDTEYESGVHQEDTEYESGVHQEDTEYESGIHQEDTGFQQTSPDIESHDCISTTQNATMSPEARSNGSNLFVPNLFVPAPVVDVDQSMEVTLESSNMASPLRGSVTASPPSPETILTNNPAKTKIPSIDDVERGLVRGEEKIKEFVTKECMPFNVYSHAKKRTSPSDELRELFLTCRKLPFRIVKGRLLVELRNRIKAPGQKTAIPSTADLFNPTDILNALQSIKMTTINAKVNRAYGQMRLYKSVQGKIKCPGYVPEKTLRDGVTAHRSILAQMVRRTAGDLSEKELSDKINSCVYEYEGGQKWVRVGEWFGGEGIILVFVTAGIASSLVTREWSVFQRECVQVISEYLPSITGLVELLGEAALDNYCRHGLLDQETIDAVVAFEGYRPLVTETEEDGSGDEDGMTEA